MRRIALQVVRKIKFVFACLGVVLGSASATPSQAQNLHSYAKGSGGGIACTYAAPCGNLGAAVAATNSEGIVSCLDGGVPEFAVIITRSVTIDCPGALAPNWNIVINTPGIVVTLRNLTISSVGESAIAGGIGIDFRNGAALFVEHCVIEHWDTAPGIGINFAPAGAAKLHVTDSVIKNNGVLGGGGGIFVVPAGGGSARVVIERTLVENNTYGIVANGSGGIALVEVSDSMVANNAIDGIWAFGGSTTSIVVDRSKSLHNGGSGINAQGTGAYVSLRDSTVAWNATGLTSASGGLILSYRNNIIGGNPNPGTSPTAVSLQ